MEKENSADSETVVPAEIALRNIGNALKVGYTVNRELVLAQRRDTIRIPRTETKLKGVSYVESVGELAGFCENCFLLLPGMV